MQTTTVVERMEAEDNSLFFQEHLARYRFASEYIQSGRVLDIACGTGYGAAILASTEGIEVIGVDIFQPTLHRAQNAYSDLSISFLAGSGTQLPFGSETFHTIVTLETIEHIADDKTFLHELARVLRSDGVCVLSTPNHQYSVDRRINNPFHVREYMADELERLLRENFGHVTLHYQGFDQSYQQEVASYQATIQIRKQSLHPMVRYAIDEIYRPIKAAIPSKLTNFFIRHLLRTSYPQPEPTAITIQPQPMPEYSVIVAVCTLPIRT